MKFYKSLNVHKRIWFKCYSHNVTGIPFSLMVELFGFRVSIDMIYEKLVMEGFIPNRDWINL